jgi:predicted metal-dependent phosphoesterase TrpH
MSSDRIPADNYDLHNHSRFSDGLLSPTELIELAARC